MKQFTSDFTSILQGSSLLVMYCRFFSNMPSIVSKYLHQASLELDNADFLLYSMLEYVHVFGCIIQFTSCYDCSNGI